MSSNSRRHRSLFKQQATVIAITQAVRRTGTMWIDDASGKTAQGDTADTIVLLDDCKGSKANVLWRGPDAGVIEGEHYWQFDVQQGRGVWVGLTAEAKFKSGYKCKGAFYGGPGNTSDGSGLITGGF
eukprot:scaffold395810_cov47-Prasinocladus_malaysianus.AAC.1